MIDLQRNDYISVYSGSQEITNNIAVSDIAEPIDQYFKRLLDSYGVLKVVVKRRNGFERDKITQKYKTVDTHDLSKTPYQVQPYENRALGSAPFAAPASNSIEVIRDSVRLEYAIRDLDKAERKAEVLEKENKALEAKLSDTKGELKDLQNANFVKDNSDSGLNGVMKAAESPAVLKIVEVFAEKFAGSSQAGGAINHKYPNLVQASEALNNDQYDLAKFCYDMILSKDPEKSAHFTTMLIEYSNSIQANN